MDEKEVEAIKKLIEKAYIEGIHRTQDRETVETGFHRDFRMLVLDNDELQKVSLDEWFPRVEKMKADNPVMWAGETEHKFHLVDVEGRAAVAKIEVHKNKQYFSTDYMLLYRFEDGWKIVSKVFTF
ncbi:MAG: nuclear transport factor 2 family protein [Candidatus Bathyarchaeota archaeon]|nr:MAG: nuclear transport factor 2 family protein [Candidatus Bathyarchaeota archaeon]